MSCTENDQPRMAVAGAKKKQGPSLCFAFQVVYMQSCARGLVRPG